MNTEQIITIELTELQVETLLPKLERLHEQESDWYLEALLNQLRIKKEQLR